jgi:hypothetical protein
VFNLRGGFFFHLVDLSELSLMAQNPPQQKKDRDEREWTSSEQKEHLQGKRIGYITAKTDNNLKAWLSLELELYFSKFPTQPVTVGEGVKHGQEWSIQDKRLFEEMVSLQIRNGNHNDSPQAR